MSSGYEALQPPASTPEEQVFKVLTAQEQRLGNVEKTRYIPTYNYTIAGQFTTTSGPSYDAGISIYVPEDAFVGIFCAVDIKTNSGGIGRVVMSETSASEFTGISVLFTTVTSYTRMHTVPGSQKGVDESAYGSFGSWLVHKPSAAGTRTYKMGYMNTFVGVTGYFQNRSMTIAVL